MEKRINSNRVLARKREKLSVTDLKDVKEVFDNLGIKFWLDMGTLLGAVRDGKIIEWDSDIDLGTFDNNWNKIALTTPQFTKRGFNILFYNFDNFVPHKNLSLKCFSLNRGGLNISFSIYQNKGNKAICVSSFKTNLVMKILMGLSCSFLSQKLFRQVMLSKKNYMFIKLIRWCLSPLQTRSKNKLNNLIKMAWLRIPKRIIVWIVPMKYFDRLETIDFYGMKFNIPSNVEDYLEYKYGNDWKIPKKDYTWWKEDGALRSV